MTFQRPNVAHDLCPYRLPCPVVSHISPPRSSSSRHPRPELCGLAVAETQDFLRPRPDNFGAPAWGNHCRKVTAAIMSSMISPRNADTHNNPPRRKRLFGAVSKSTPGLPVASCASFFPMPLMRSILFSRISASRRNIHVNITARPAPSISSMVTVRRSTLPRCEQRAGGSVFRRPLFGCQVGEMPYGFTARL